MTKMRNSVGSNVIASGAWQSAKGGVATRYSSDETVGQAINDVIGRNV